jgi:hypothetical protein
VPLCVQRLRHTGAEVPEPDNDETLHDCNVEL